MQSLRLKVGILSIKLILLNAQCFIKNALILIMISNFLLFFHFLDIIVSLSEKHVLRLWSIIDSIAIMISLVHELRLVCFVEIR